MDLNAMPSNASMPNCLWTQNMTILLSVTERQSDGVTEQQSDRATDRHGGLLGCDGRIQKSSWLEQPSLLQAFECVFQLSIYEGLSICLSNCLSVMLQQKSKNLSGLITEQSKKGTRKTVIMTIITIMTMTSYKTL